MRQFGTAVAALTVCLLGIGTSHEAKAQNVSGSVQIDAIDSVGTTYSPNSTGTNTCSGVPGCTVSESESGPNTQASGSANVNLNQQVIGIFTSKPLLELSPTMNASSSLSATVAPPDAMVAPGVGIGVTGQWQMPFAANDLTGTEFSINPPPALTGGTLEWGNTFTNFSGGPSTIQFTFTVSGTGIGGVPISSEKLLDLACTGVSCALTFQSDGVEYFGPFQNPSFNVLLSLGDNWASDIPLTLSEMVTVSAFTPLAPSTNGFSFNDPTTLTYLDANGNVVPNLVFYNSDLNAIMPLSGQEFTPVSDTPLPAGLPLFATGLGALGLLGWRRKRKPQAVA